MSQMKIESWYPASALRWSLRSAPSRYRTPNLANRNGESIRSVRRTKMPMGLQEKGIGCVTKKPVDRSNQNRLAFAPGQLFVAMPWALPPACEPTGPGPLGIKRREVNFRRRWTS
jgi:hypothetical protein